MRLRQTTVDQHCDDCARRKHEECQSTRVSHSNHKKWRNTQNTATSRDETCTSSGRPLASAIVCAKWSEHSGERSECLITTELPAMTAGITELTCGCADVIQSGMRA